MATWPSGTKASATTTAADSNSISGARGDINQAITNQNEIIDMFNIPASPTDNYILVYNSATSQFDVEANSAAISQLSQDLDQNGFMIKDDSRNFQILGNQSNTTTLSNVFDAVNNTARVHGVINVNYQDGYPSNRIHTNPTLTYIKADADATPGSSSPGRIRANIVETQYDLNSYDNTTSNFGQGFNNMFVSGVAKNTAAGTTSNLTRASAITITPQIDQADEPTANTIITDHTGLEVNAYLDGSGSSSTNFYGFRYTSPSGANSSRVGLTNHYSFYGEESGATLYNAGPLEASGLKYPTSDGSANQVIKTDGSGNLSFTSVSVSAFSGGTTYDNGTIAANGTCNIDYSNGPIQQATFTSDSDAGTAITLAVPTNMSDGDVLYFLVKASGSSGDTATWNLATGGSYYAPSGTSNYGQSGGDHYIFRIIRMNTKYYYEQMSNNNQQIS